MRAAVFTENDGDLSVEDVSPPARHRLYQATAEANYVLDEHDHRVEVSL